MLLEDPGAAIAPPPQPSNAGEQAQVGEAAEGEVDATGQAIEATQVSLEGSDKEPEAEDNSNCRCSDAKAITANRHSCSGALMGTDGSNHLEAPAAKGQPTIEAARLPFGAEASASGTAGVREGSQAGSASKSGSPAKMCAEVMKRGSSEWLVSGGGQPASAGGPGSMAAIFLVTLLLLW
ncbi:hypothetical protein VaNZ11_000456 [Volvox africanus]|uniref:Uncharacterized protein n=1 Tax=Volvox africanus TaxID=51714 RepID=A0ABQ5RM94_9CHLO|nr:hypothetical protein VaNZ11_000456 [Volvox africanus]